MDSIDIDLLTYVSERDKLNEVKGYISKGLCVKESWTILQDFIQYFKDHPNATKIDSDFKLWQRTIRHPEWKTDTARIYSGIIDSVIANTTPNRAVFLDTLRELRLQAKYKDVSERLAAGKITADDAATELQAEHKRSTIQLPRTVSYTLTNLATQAQGAGFYWRLEDLNRSIGPIKKGDFVVVAKRPEVGGTSFLVSEMAFMLEQTNGNAVMFNNEEEPTKVYTRMVSTALDVDYRHLMANPSKYDSDYQAWLSGSTWDLVHDTQMTLHSIRDQLEEKEYDLIGINVLLKVGGTDKAEDHDKFQALGEACRVIAQDYGPVIAIVQADPTAEGLQYIPQDRIYKSKTALQGEADALIMIGTDDPPIDTVRYISVAKNKMPPAPCTDAQSKHIKSQVHFNPETGRFSSTNYVNNSRPKQWNVSNTTSI